jgi:peptidyl-prolyl cis-trans isomerase A (cyclophilin A)
MLRTDSLPLALIAGLALVGCGEGEETVEVTVEGLDAPDAPVYQATTPTGETVVFAGPHNRGSERTQGRSSTRYDEDELIREPNEPDPEGGEFTLEEAVEGMPIDGALIAEIATQFGDILCELDPRRSPIATANFIGLARGLRPWWDARAGEWVRRPYYAGLTFHRVIPEYLIQGGDYLGDGTGTVGYTIADESDDTLAHDRAGQLAMANMDGPNSAGAQFFISDGPAPPLDGQGYTIFGQCRPTDVIAQIARVPQNPDEGNRPLTEVTIRRVLIRRVVGGLAAAEPTRPEIPEELRTPRGASPDPSARGRGEIGRAHV